MFEDGIHLLDISKEYGCQSGKTLALDRIDLKIGRGEFVGLAGANGSGKTSLIRHLNGLVLPSRGKVYINGMDTGSRRHIGEIRRLVGMVFQNPDNQIVSPVVEEELAFGPENLNLPVAEVKRRVQWALSLLELEPLRHHSPHLLSGGQKQRVAIASALTMLPSFLVLDEPTSMLDQKGRREVMEALQNLNKEHGITVVIASHNMDDLAAVDRLLILQEGRLEFDGPPWEIFSSPERMSDYGLKSPAIPSLVRSLNRRGHKLDETMVSWKEMVAWICQL